MKAMKNKGPPDLLHMSCSLLIGSLEFRVEIFASLQGSPQHCSLWVDSHVLLRPAEEFNLRLTESLQQLRKCWSGGGLGVPVKDRIISINTQRELALLFVQLDQHVGRNVCLTKLATFNELLLHHTM